MRAMAISILLLVVLGYHSDGRSFRMTLVTPTVSAQSSPAPGSGESGTKVDFASDVEPILKAKCQGCHFSGGKMYHELPFDRPGTIKKLGSKLFTRIKDENDRKVIREFLAQE